MKLKYNFELMDMDDTVVAVPVGEHADEFHGVIRLNDSAAEIFRQLQEKTTEEQVVSALQKQYSTAPEEIADFVHGYIDHLRKEALLDE